MSTRVGLAVIGVTCIVAAGTGGYLATRQANAPAAAASPAPTASAQPPVQETEATVDDGNAARVPATTSAVKETPVETAAAREIAPGSVPVAAPPSKHTPSAPAHEGPPRERTPQAARRTTVDDQASRSAQSVPASAPPATAGAAPVDPLPAPETARRAEPVEPVRDPEPRFEELVVPSDSVIGLQIESTVSSETAQVEDRVDARVTRDLTVDGRVAVPAGSRVRGAVMVVDRGGKMRDRARLGVRFHTLVLTDGTTLPLQTETIFREGESPTSSSSAKIGGAAIGGALLGAIIGGARGAVIGGTTGAAGGTAAVMAGGRKPATLSAGSTMTVRVLSPVSVTVERE